MQQALTILLVVSALLALCLTALTVARKLRRDRNEARYLARRERFRHLLLGGSVDDLEAALRGAGQREHAQIDLLVTLDALGPELDATRLDQARVAAHAAGLDRVLVGRLRSRDPIRRGLAALLVGRLVLPDASDLVAPLLHDRDGDVRLAAVRALGTVADDAAAHHLIAALRVRDLEPERVIERLGAAWAVPAMLRVLDGGWSEFPAATRRPDEPVAWRAVDASLARALGLAADPRAEPALRSLLRTGAVEERIAAARALGSAGSLAAAGDLEAALEDTTWPVRAQAARSLGRLGATDAVPALTPHLSDQAWWVRAAVADALVDLGEPGLAVLHDALEHADPYARDRAREALAVHRLGTDGR